MSDSSAPKSPAEEACPPEEVLVEFVRLLTSTVREFEETLVPVLRGSLLLRHWFGERARPSVDVDLECFEGEPAVELTEEQQQWREEGLGRYGEFTSLVDFGKAMSRYAVQSTQYYRYRDQPQPTIEFAETEHPDDGDSLWTYGTPGERYYTGWTIREPASGFTGHLASLAGKRPNGVLQIDIAEKGRYDLADVGVEPLPLMAADGSTFDCPAYTHEMLLAAKLSWLLRSFDREAPRWTGEPKDLFDAHLLLTEGEIDGTELRRCLLAVGREDELEWNRIDVLFAARDALDDAAFENWSEFHERYGSLVDRGPAELLGELLDRLDPLLGEFRLPDESAFLLAIDADPLDETNYLPYADWLEERGDPRSDILRGFVAIAFHEDDTTFDELEAGRTHLRYALRAAPEPWLCRLLGTSERLDSLRRGLGVE